MYLGGYLMVVKGKGKVLVGIDKEKEIVRQLQAKKGPYYEEWLRGYRRMLDFNGKRNRK